MPPCAKPRIRQPTSPPQAPVTALSRELVASQLAANDSVAHALDASVVAEIRRQNALELEVYRVAGHLLDAQVALARGATGEKPG